MILYKTMFLDFDNIDFLLSYFQNTVLLSKVLNMIIQHHTTHLQKSDLEDFVGSETSGGPLIS